jgi:hypothetical protein
LLPWLLVVRCRFCSGYTLFLYRELRRTAKHFDFSLQLICTCLHHNNLICIVREVGLTFKRQPHADIIIQTDNHNQNQLTAHSAKEELLQNI